jgi:hypothetical protein
VKIGDLVARTYGEGRRPTGIIVGWHGTSRSIVTVLWVGATVQDIIGTRDLEVIDENR